MHRYNGQLYLYEPTSKGECSCNKKSCSSIGKHPRVKNGLKDATTNLVTIKAWWNKWPKANIGIVTGHESNLIVLDVDYKNGGLASLSSLESQHGSVPGSKAQSGGNGFHFYFHDQKNALIRNKVNLLPGIDFRGDGGYIVAPPSAHQKW